MKNYIPTITPMFEDKISLAMDRLVMQLPRGWDRDQSGMSFRKGRFSIEIADGPVYVIKDKDEELLRTDDPANVARYIKNIL